MEGFTTNFLPLSVAILQLLFISPLNLIKFLIAFIVEVINYINCNIMVCSRLCKQLSFGSKLYVKGSKQCVVCDLFIITESEQCACCGLKLNHVSQLEPLPFSLTH